MWMTSAQVRANANVSVEKKHSLSDWQHVMCNARRATRHFDNEESKAGAVARTMIVSSPRFTVRTTA
jgi:hypothetical protein